MSLSAYVATLVFIAVQALWCFLERGGLLPRSASMGFVVVTFGLAVWLLPYFCATQVAQRSGETPV
jgi:hypothetical protein